MPSTTQDPKARTAKARATALQRAAERAAADPTKLKSAARCVGAAIADDQVSEHVRRVVDTAPELTPEQRDRLARLLRFGGQA
jgi:hypothetical protein